MVRRQSKESNRRGGGAAIGTILLLLLLSACDDVLGIIDPCAKDGACEVDGISFVVDELETNAMLISDLNRYFIPAGSELEIQYAIRNRGDETSAAEEVQICLSTGTGTSCSQLTRSVVVDPLGPGDIAAGTLTFDLPSDVSGRRNAVARVSHRSHSVSSREVTIERPDFHSEISLLEPEARAGELAMMQVEIRNAAHVADAPVSRAGACLSWGSNPQCLSGHELEMFDVPALRSGDIWTDTVPYRIPLAALQYPDDVTNRRLSVRANANDAIDEGSTSQNWAHADLTVLLNLDLACPVTELTEGEPVAGTLTSAGCDLRWMSGVNVYRMEVEEGQLYRLQIESADGAAHRWSGLVLSRRGTQITELTTHSQTTQRDIDFASAHSGIYHVVVGHGSRNFHPSNGQQYHVRVLKR